MNRCDHIGRRAGEVRRCVLPVNHGAPLHQYGPIAQYSAARLVENRARTEALRPLREAQTWCSRCGVTGIGLDAHEVLSRARGGSITDLANIVLCCRPCHSWITENPAAAKAEGWAA